MSELSTMIEALVADLDLVLGIQTAADDETEPGTCTVRYAYRESGGKYGEVTAEELDELLEAKTVEGVLDTGLGAVVSDKEAFLHARGQMRSALGLDKDDKDPVAEPTTVRLRANKGEWRDVDSELVERLIAYLTAELMAHDRRLRIARLGTAVNIIHPSPSMEPAILKYLRRAEREEQMQSVLDSFKTRKQVLNEAGLHGENVAEQVKPLAQALDRAQSMRVSIPLPDRERLVALLHSQTRLTDERVADIAEVLAQAQPVPNTPDLRPALQENLTALGQSLYWLRECLKSDTEPFIGQHLSRGLEQIQTQMGKTERLIQETK